MAKHYSKDELKVIGEQCGNRLPPASAVQAMFLYEMQRNTDLERLFQGQMFQLAKAKEHFSSQDDHTSNLSKQVDTLRQEIAVARDIEQRVSMSKVRMDSFQLKLSDVTSEMRNQSERMVRLEEKVSDVIASTKDLGPKMEGKSPDIANLTTKLANQSAGLECVQSELSTLNSDVAVLFEERDAMASLLNEAKARPDELDKDYLYEMNELKSEVCELARGAKAERQALAQAEGAKQAALEYVAMVERRVISLIDQATKRMVEIEQETLKKIAGFETQAHSHIALVEQGTGTEISHMDKKVTDRLNKIEQQLKEQIDLTDQKANLLIGEVGKYKWMADLEKQGLQDITDSVNRMRVKFEDQLWDSTKDLQSQVQSQADEQNERMSRLEDLVRALTGQSENSSPTSSQLLCVQAGNGQSYDLSVPKGQPFVPYKAENVRSFTPGKRWMA